MSFIVITLALGYFTYLKATWEILYLQNPFHLFKKKKKERNHILNIGWHQENTKMSDI